MEVEAFVKGLGPCFLLEELVSKPESLASYFVLLNRQFPERWIRASVYLRQVLPTRTLQCHRDVPASVACEVSATVIKT